MADAVYISEAEATRDFSGLVDRALTGEKIVVRRDGRDVVMLVQVVPGAVGQVKTLGHVIEGLRKRETEQGLATLDDEFASQMEAIHEGLNVAMDASPWD